MSEFGAAAGAPAAGSPAAGSPAAGSPAAVSHQADAAQRRRLRWRARRGLLENDLVLTRFLDHQEHRLTDDEVVGLDRLLDLTDNELLDLILGRRELDESEDPRAQHVLQLLRSA